MERLMKENEIERENWREGIQKSGKGKLDERKIGVGSLD